MSHFHQDPHIIRKLAPFKMDDLAIPYAEFVPKLFNLCMTLGFRKGLIMPSRAFCSDENQGWPIILLTKHFGTFPFNHGRVGGIIASDRHGPHAHHGEDSVIIQATHVGYDPQTGTYGQWVRPKMEGTCSSSSCGKITQVITPYLEEYHFAQARIFLHRDESGRHLITTKNAFVDFNARPIKNGLVLLLEDIARVDTSGHITPVAAHTTSQTYELADKFSKRIETAGYVWKGGKGESIGKYLYEDIFCFRKDFQETGESLLLESSLLEFMPAIVAAPSPSLRAAEICIQLEFARTVESIRRGTEYNGKNLLYLSGLNIDISEYEGFPATTYFIPWAAHIQLKDGIHEEYVHPVEQDHLFNLLMAQSSENPEQIGLNEQIARMLAAPRFDIRSPQ